MFKKVFLVAVIISVSLITGCASVPMAPMEQDSALKVFHRLQQIKLVCTYIETAL